LKSTFKYESCSNESDLGIVLDKGIEPVKNGPHGHLGKHPIDALANGSSPQRRFWTATGT
jgi:hypothetical protein